MSERSIELSSEVSTSITAISGSTTSPPLPLRLHSLPSLSVLSRVTRLRPATQLVFPVFPLYRVQTSCHRCYQRAAPPASTATTSLDSVLVRGPFALPAAGRPLQVPHQMHIIDASVSPDVARHNGIRIEPGTTPAMGTTPAACGKAPVAYVNSQLQLGDNIARLIEAEKLVSTTSHLRVPNQQDCVAAQGRVGCVFE